MLGATNHLLVICVAIIFSHFKAYPFNFDEQRFSILMEQIY